MRKALLVLLLGSYAFAVDFEATKESSRGLSGALASSVDSVYSNAEYIVGYGWHYNSAGVNFNPGTAVASVDTMVSLLTSLAPMIEGLEPNDWVSASYEADQHVLVRVKPSQPDTLEVWVDGVKR